MKKNFLNLIAVMIIVLIMSACTSGTGEESKKSKDTEAGNITIALASEPSTLMGSVDPAASTSGIIRNIYGSPMTYDGESDFNYDLVTEFESIDDNTWEFKFREDVTFHNGEPFDIEAVKYTVDFMMDPANESIYGKWWINEVEGYEVIDDYTIRFKTKEPNAGFAHKLATDIHPLEPKYVEEVGIEEASRNPIGTGAYKVVEWNRGEFIKFEAFDDYWRGEPEIKEVTIEFIPEFSSRLSSLLSGDLDLIKSVPVDSIDRVEIDDNYKVISKETGKNSFIALNTFKEGPLQDKKVRQALNHAVDIDSLIDNVMEGRATRLYSTIVPFNMSHYDGLEGYNYDPDKAIKLLDEAGYKPEDLNFTIETTNGYFPMDSQITQAFAGELEKLGMNITINQDEVGNFIQRVTSQKMEDMYFFTSAYATDGISFYSYYYTPDGAYRATNDEKLLQEIEDKMDVFEPKAHQKSMDEIQKKLSEEATTVPLWYGEDTWGAKSDVYFEPEINEALVLYNISRKE